MNAPNDVHSSSAPFRGWPEGMGGRSVVLVVEDDPDLLELMKVILEENGFTVQTARDGREALECLRRIAGPCVVVLDLYMPVMSGDEFLKALRADERPEMASLPVVVVSAAEGQAARDARKLADVFMKKPMDVDRFLDTVKRLCAA